jgi:hypothetical protein
VRSEKEEVKRKRVFTTMDTKKHQGKNEKKRAERRINHQEGRS